MWPGTWTMNQEAYAKMYGPGPGTGGDCDGAGAGRTSGSNGDDAAAHAARNRHDADGRDTGHVGTAAADMPGWMQSLLDSGRSSRGTGQQPSLHQPSSSSAAPLSSTAASSTGSPILAAAMSCFSYLGRLPLTLIREYVYEWAFREPWCPQSMDDGRLEVFACRSLFQISAVVGTKTGIFGGLLRLGQPSELLVEFAEPAYVAASYASTPRHPHLDRVLHAAHLQREGSSAGAGGTAEGASGAVTQRQQHKHGAVADVGIELAYAVANAVHPHLDHICPTGTIIAGTTCATATTATNGGKYHQQQQQPSRHHHIRSPTSAVSPSSFQPGTDAAVAGSDIESGPAFAAASTAKPRPGGAAVGDELGDLATTSAAAAMTGAASHAQAAPLLTSAGPLHAPAGTFAPVAPSSERVVIGAGAEDAPAGGVSHTASNNGNGSGLIRSAASRLKARAGRMKDRLLSVASNTAGSLKSSMSPASIPRRVVSKISTNVTKLSTNIAGRTSGGASMSRRARQAERNVVMAQPELIDVEDGNDGSGGAGDASPHGHSGGEDVHDHHDHDADWLTDDHDTSSTCSSHYSESEAGDASTAPPSAALHAHTGSIGVRAASDASAPASASSAQALLLSPIPEGRPALRHSNQSQLADGSGGGSGFEAAAGSDSDRPPLQHASRPSSFSIIDIDAGGGSASTSLLCAEAGGGAGAGVGGPGTALSSVAERVATADQQATHRPRSGSHHRHRGRSDSGGGGDGQAHLPLWQQRQQNHQRSNSRSRSSTGSRSRSRDIDAPRSAAASVEHGFGYGPVAINGTGSGVLGLDGRADERHDGTPSQSSSTHHLHWPHMPHHGHLAGRRISLHRHYHHSRSDSNHKEAGRVRHGRQPKGYATLHRAQIPSELELQQQQQQMQANGASSAVPGAAAASAVAAVAGGGAGPRATSPAAAVMLQPKSPATLAAVPVPPPQAHAEAVNAVTAPTAPSSSAPAAVVVEQGRGGKIVFSPSSSHPAVSATGMRARHQHQLVNHHADGQRHYSDDFDGADDAVGGRLEATSATVGEDTVASERDTSASTPTRTRRATATATGVSFDTPTPASAASTKRAAISAGMRTAFQTGGTGTADHELLPSGQSLEPGTGVAITSPTPRSHLDTADSPMMSSSPATPGRTVHLTSSKPSTATGAAVRGVHASRSPSKASSSAAAPAAVVASPPQPPAGPRRVLSPDSEPIFIQVDGEAYKVFGLKRVHISYACKASMVTFK